SQKTVEEREGFIRFIDDIDHKVARIAQWDFIHRFPGANGIKVLRGGDKNTGDSGGAYIPGQETVFRNSTFFAHDSMYAQTFATKITPIKNGYVLIADVPISSIQHTSWSFFDPRGNVYEPEINVVGKASILQVFHFKDMTEYEQWMQYRHEYSDA